MPAVAPEAPQVGEGMAKAPQTPVEPLEGRSASFVNAPVERFSLPFVGPVVRKTSASRKPFSD
jgi:hypothetical protein